MSNFKFLLKESDYQEFSRACVDAEQAMLSSTVSTCIMSRRALELAVKWMYKYDMDLHLPYDDRLSALINDYTFVDIVGKDVLHTIRFIVKAGNNAAHNSGKINQSTAMTSLRNLFEFIQWIDYSYGDNYQERAFDENKVPTAKKLLERLNALEKEKLVAEAKVDSTKSLAEVREEADDTVQEELTEKRQQAETIHHAPFKLDPITEEITRKEFINVDLALAGWKLGQNVEEELELKGMPNQSEKGFADYVLYGKDGLPLAVVEAKRTQKDPNVGAHQAELYAELIEKQFGRRPFIFITNGFSMWFTDDVSRRKVSGFYTQDDLQRLIDRRKIKSPLNRVRINTEIASRPYQRLAINSALESFSQNKRDALLVMATGTGKTRTAISIVDVLTRANWAKNILFLADRTALVKQAMRNFNKLLPELTVANLTESNRADNDPRTARMIFSTYPTMMNAIDNLRNDEEDRIFSVGHFDLIVIDEAHRSIYKKYQAIFDYFDSMILGLTATPREDIDRNTYEIFNLENGVPTFAYDLEEAVNEGYLVDYRTVEAELKFPVDGIKYDDLSSEEQELFEDTFADEVGFEIAGSAINNWVFNIDTIDKVILHFMEHGLRTSSGNDIGKTIVFAQNQRHADLIKERFDLLYPEKGPNYAAVITYNVNYAQDLIDRFSVKDKLPQIAISVNMLDTGIDVPEVQNLVFFKKVRSKTMFWQMVGRGTRLCKDLLGPGQDKEYFLIFDYASNFEYFRVATREDNTKLGRSLTERLFLVKVDLIKELSALAYQDEKEYVELREKLLREVLGEINKLDEENFRVRQHLQYVVKYKEELNWQSIGLLDTAELEEHIAPLIHASSDAEVVQRFYLLMQVIEVGVLLDRVPTRAVNTVIGIAQALTSLGNIPQVQAKSEIINELLDESFWEKASVIRLEKIREELRDLVQLIPWKPPKWYEINLKDEFLKISEDEPPMYQTLNLGNYRDKVEAYIREQSTNPVIQKIYNNESISSADLSEIENVLFHDLGTAEDYKSYYGEKPIAQLIREITGLDKAAVQKAFAEFLDTYDLNRDQTEFMRVLMQYFENNGYLEVKQFQEEPFKSIGSISVVFQQNIQQIKELIEIVNKINSNLQVA